MTPCKVNPDKYDPWRNKSFQNERWIMSGWVLAKFPPTKICHVSFKNGHSLDANDSSSIPRNSCIKSNIAFEYVWVTILFGCHLLFFHPARWRHWQQWKEYNSFTTFWVGFCKNLNVNLFSRLWNNSTVFRFSFEWSHLSAYSCVIQIMLTQFYCIID